MYSNRYVKILALCYIRQYPAKCAILGYKYMKKILILGGGFAGVETFMRLHKHFHPPNPDNVRIELISKSNFFTFSPMLHEAATGSVAREHVIQPLREILSCCGKDFHQANIQRIDFDTNTVETDQGKHTYDILVISLGVEQGFFGVPGAAEHALALKWLPGAVDIRNRIINSFERASEMHDRNNMEELKRFLRFVIVGAGATGTELAGQISDLVGREMMYFYGDVPHSLFELILVHAGDRVLEQLSPQSSTKVQKRLEKLGVNVRLNEQVVEVTSKGVKLKSGEEIASNSVFWTAGTETTLKQLVPEKLLTERGLLAVSSTFQVPGHENVFALGDCATVGEEHYRFPPTAQAAVQEASIVSHNIRAYLHGKPAQQRPYIHKGDIIPIGNWWAVFERRPFRFTGRIAWLMRRFVFLKTMYGWGNRIEVAFAWLVRTFLPRDTSEF